MWLNYLLCCSFLGTAQQMLHGGGGKSIAAAAAINLQLVPPVSGGNK